ncbi:hypothetical protein [Microbulbifer discodermiae]|uniref:hypothetical protein n=1 Tax=Microbulbifer sp. 2201CG32-9 TaxID=3232309 RepID=UPI00345C5F51
MLAIFEAYHYGQTMRFHTARQAWHDAFDSPSQQFDYAAALKAQAVFGRSAKRYTDEIRDEDGKITARMPAQTLYAVETRVGKGSGGRIMDACEKGLVQNAVARLRQTDPLAYSWGMAAYAPPAARFKERAALLHYLMTEFDQWGEPHNRTQVSKLAFFCINACALRDVNGRPIDLRQVRTILGCNKSTWDRHWKSLWQRFQRRLDPLPARALGPVSEMVERYKEKLHASG